MYSFLVGPMAYLILLNSSFISDQSGFYNRDQEERSFGLHVATPIELKLFFNLTQIRQYESIYKTYAKLL